MPFLVAAVELVRLAVLLRRPEGKLASMAADDAFYYMQTARNFAATGRWTFDGVEPASGFHLLWGYLLAALYRVAPGIGFHAVYASAELLETACLAVAASLAVRTAVRLFGPAAEWGVAVVFLSAVSLTVPGMMMESSLAIMFSAATIAFVFGGNERYFVAVLLGLGGVLARSDAALLPAVLLATCAAMWGRRLLPGRRVALAGAVLAGALAGMAVVALHTHWISGEWMQSSAREKLWWSRVQGFSSVPAEHLVLSFFNGGAVQIWSDRLAQAGVQGARVMFRVLLLGALLAGWQGRRDRRVWAVAGLVLVIAGYLFAYRFACADLQDWYIGNFEVPVALVTGAAVAWFAGRWRRTTAAAVAILCGCGLACSVAPTRDYVSPLYSAALALREHPELRPAGAWNAGEIGYFSGGGVVNLDGLVNDRIYPYSVRGTLFDYVHKRGLRTIVDVPLMLDPAVQRAYHEEGFPRRYGYADGRLERCVDETNPSGGPTAGDPDNLPFVMFHVRPDCY